MNTTKIFLIIASMQAIRIQATNMVDEVQLIMDSNGIHFEIK